jgi:uncharacterized protein (DUF427 family)
MKVTLGRRHLPPRYYIPPEDVRDDVLLSSDKETQCPYKGIASYHSVEAGGETVEDLVWYYPEPITAVEEIRPTSASTTRRWIWRSTERPKSAPSRAGRSPYQ